MSGDFHLLFAGLLATSVDLKRTAAGNIDTFFSLGFQVQGHSEMFPKYSVGTTPLLSSSHDLNPPKL